MSSLRNAKVLVTGAGGFLGSNVCRALGDVGADVFGVARSGSSGMDKAIRWLEGDLKDLATVQGFVRVIRPDFVFHLAGAARASRSVELVVPTMQDNLVSTVNLLTALETVGSRSRVVLPGSLEEPSPETGFDPPSSPYAASKWAGSMYGRMFHRCYGTPVVILRIFMTYGPRQRRDRVIPYTILSLLKDEQPRISSGNRVVDWVYVDDVVDGILQAAIKEGVDGCTIDLGSGVGVSVRDVVGTISNIIRSGTEAAFGDPLRASEVERIANTHHSYSVLGWKPMTSLTKGLEQTVEWYRRN